MLLEVIGHREAMTIGHNSHICHPGPFTLTLVSFSIAAEKILPGAEREGSRGQHPGDADGTKGTVGSLGEAFPPDSSHSWQG